MNIDVKKEISKFQNYYVTKPVGKTTIIQFCNIIKSDRHISQISKIRNPNTPDEVRKKIKSSLQSVTISGVFSERSTSGFLSHSGFICIDIDGKDNPDVKDWPVLRDRMMGYKNILFSAISVSSKGIFLIIPLAYPDEHLSHFKRLKRDFEIGLNLIIDPACSDISRLRNISYDPQAKINLYATPYIGLYRENPPETLYTCNVEDDFIKLLDLIVLKKIDITQNYKHWFAIGCAFANELGEAGREYFHKVSQFYREYSYEEANVQYNKCLRKSYNYKKDSIFYIADKYGINLKRDEELLSNYGDSLR